MSAPHDVAPSANRFRVRRFHLFRSLVHLTKGARPVRVLDLGGTAEYWRALEPLWRDLDLEITLLNPAIPIDRAPRFHHVEGDARDLAAIPDGAFDIVHSNSVIEHVGDGAQRAAFAREARRVAPRHFIQTPNFWFPIEPHVQLPLFHWLPDPWGETLLTWRRWGHVPRAPDRAAAAAALGQMRLLSRREMARLFPDSVIVPETWCGLTKSLIAIRA